jgi:predicted enzyme related to lactoylglutathione lyase
MVSIAAKDLAASHAFYTAVFGWPMEALSAELIVGAPPAGPSVVLRGNVPDGFQGAVPFLDCTDVPAMLDRVVAAGGTVERAPWPGPMGARLARFADPSGTLYGLASGLLPAKPPRIEMPFGDNPRPPAGALCSLEMYAADGDAVTAFVGGLFGWGAAPTMPHFVGFDPGAGIGGVFQSHTPVAKSMAYIYSADVSTTIAAIEAAGGKRMGDPMAIPGMGTFGYFTDVSGTAMGLIGP